MRRIVCLGDSLTSGHGIGTAAAFPAILHQRVRRAGYPYEVVNAGVSPATSAEARGRLGRAPQGGVRGLILAPGPHAGVRGGRGRALEGDVGVLIVALGANDGLRGVPVADLTANIASIIEAAQKRSISVLLCGMEALPIYGWAYTAAFHKAFVDLAAKYSV